MAAPTPQYAPEIFGALGKILMNLRQKDVCCWH